jgi:hypothetical protein
VRGGAEFSVGQDVRLAQKQARVAENVGLAVAGTVTGIERKKDGTRVYTVHFPGRTGTRHGLPAGVLEETESPAVRPQGGGGPFSIKEAEELLIGTSAGSSGDRERDKALWRNLGTSSAQLFAGLADASGMALPDLLEQLAPRIVRRKGELGTGKRAGPAAVAASDIPQAPGTRAAPGRATAAPDHAPTPRVPAQRRTGPGR